VTSYDVYIGRERTNEQEIAADEKKESLQNGLFQCVIGIQIIDEKKENKQNG